MINSNLHHRNRKDKEIAKRIFEKATKSTNILSNSKPLTLEQLRKMDKMPAFGISLINEKPGEWFIVRVMEMRKNWLIACVGASQDFGDKDTYGESWHPPARIDREKWEPCEECEKSCCNCVDGGRR